MLEAVRPKTPLEALQKFFGYPQFRAGQEEIIRAAIDGADTLVVMPTGGGKSLCFQIPALIVSGVMVVVSPLIALMKDQVDALARRGVRATTINSTLDFQSVCQRMNDIRYGLYSLVYVAPERFENQNFLEQIKGIPISLLAVDEAHCISEWGHDFRPSYLKLREAIESLGRPPVIALTATATPHVQEDIIVQLGLKNPRRFVRGFDRPNLNYNVVASTDKDAALREIIKREMERDGACIVYCGTRRAVEAVGVMLHAEKVPVAVYHGGMLDRDRQRAQEAFIEGRAKPIVATNAFGMGIDKADVRHVIHYDMPGSIEAYYQEAGRAGRDKKPSDCTLLYSASDRRLQEFFIRNSFPTREQLEAVYNAIWDTLQVGVGSRYEGIFVPNDRDIAGRARIHTASLPNIYNVLEKNDILRKLRADRLGAIRFTAKGSDVQDYYQRTRDDERKKAIIALLRTLGGAALSQETLFNPEDLASRHGLTLESFERSMRALMMSGLLRYTPPTPGSGIQFVNERMALRSLKIDEKALEAGRTRALQKLDAMERYVNSGACRRNFILEYFCAESDGDVCGRCDLCTSAPTPAPAEMRPHSRRAAEQLMAAVSELGGRFGKMTVIDILRGTKISTVTQFGLERYHRFGELRDLQRAELARLADQLIGSRLLESSATLNPTIRLTRDGEAAIRHLSLKMFSPAPREREEVLNDDLLLRLREERGRIAERDGRSLESICGDLMLVRISNALPTTRKSFMEIDGATDQLYESCGTSFITLIGSVLAESQQEGTGLPERLRRTYALLGEGNSVEEIARRSALQPATVSGHIEELIGAGVDLDIDSLVLPGLVKAVREQLKRMPKASLRELRALLGGAIAYPELRIAAAWIRAGK